MSRYPLQKWDLCSKDIHKNAHRSTGHRRQKLEMTQVPNYNKMYSGILTQWAVPPLGKLLELLRHSNVEQTMLRKRNETKNNTRCLYALRISKQTLYVLGSQELSYPWETGGSSYRGGCAIRVPVRFYFLAWVVDMRVNSLCHYSARLYLWSMYCLVFTLYIQG